MQWLWFKFDHQLASAYGTLAFFAACAAVVGFHLLTGRHVPLPILLIAPVMVAAALFNVYHARQDAERDRRIANNCCPACGYDLRGQTVRCPECGDPVGMGHDSAHVDHR